MNYEISPGEGCGPLRFGDDCPHVEAALGKPNRVVEEGPESESTIGWHYEELGLTCLFDEDAEFRLTVIDVDALETSVLGLRPIGLAIAEAKKLFSEKIELRMDEELSDEDNAVYDLGDTGVSLWFNQGHCDSVQVTVGVDDEDEYIWPEASR
jgi:hypothetical protein